MKTHQYILATATLIIAHALPLVSSCKEIKFDQSYLRFSESFHVASYYDVKENTVYTAKVQRQSGQDGTPAGEFKYQLKEPGGEYGSVTVEKFVEDSPHTKVQWVNDSPSVCHAPLAPTQDTDHEIKVQYYTINETPPSGYKEAKLRYKLRHDTSYFKTDYERFNKKELEKTQESAYACGGTIHVYDILAALPPAGENLKDKFRASNYQGVAKVYKCVLSGGSYQWIEQGNLPRSDSHFAQ
ncbi:MAG: hypothetical protein N2595_07795 [bacterium]|nr:hypothetical protein [bacterium]